MTTTAAARPSSRRRAALVARRAPLDALTAGQVLAGPSVQMPGGARVPMGIPLDEPVLTALSDGGVDSVEILAGDEDMLAQAVSPTGRGRAEVLETVLRGAVARTPIEHRAVDPAHGAAAKAAVGSAVRTAAWLPAISDLLVAEGALDCDFLHPATETAVLTSVIGAAYGWGEDALAELALGALLADVGMLRVRPEIRFKPGRLTPLERREMQRHATEGAEMLSPLRRIAPMVVKIAQEHHERVDGAGYPSGIAGRNVGLESQVVALAHRYLAALSARPYRDAMQAHQAAEVVASLGGQLADPKLCQAFGTAVAIYPVGTLVSLSDGRSGRVKRVGDMPARPVVEVLWDANGRAGDAEIIDLARAPAVFLRA